MDLVFTCGHGECGRLLPLRRSGLDRVHRTDHGAISEIDPDRALLIADFGLGTDSPIVLDHRHQPEPSMLALDWQVSGDEAPFTVTTTWTMLAASLDEFGRSLPVMCRAIRVDRSTVGV